MTDPDDKNVTHDSMLDLATAWYVESAERGHAPSDEEMRERFPEIYTELRAFADDYLQFGAIARDSSTGPKGGADPEILRQFGDYELLHQIGRGGMGVVYKARQNSLNRIVALKLILAGKLASDDEVRRFQREANAAAQLQHPNIVSVYDFQEREHQYYLSMEFVQGPTLADLIRDRPLELGKSVRIIKTVAEAIDYAHQKGIIHRDVKPSNIILETSTSEPRLTDFGLAKRISVDPHGSATAEFGLRTQTADGLTTSGSLVGTCFYMAPEQTLPDSAVVGPSADIYALGATLYELLTGLPPLRANDLLELLVTIREVEPTAPRRIDEKIPVDLQKICLKCLEKDPHRRYESAQELADDLGRYLRGEPVHARAIGPVRRAFKWVRRNPQTAAIFGVAAAALMVITAGGYVVAIGEATRNLLIRKLASQEADARQQVQGLLMQSYSDVGLGLLDDGDVLAALSPFVQSMRLGDSSSEKYKLQQLRCQMLIDSVPRLQHLWFQDGAISDLEVSSDGKLLAASSGDCTIVWSIETGERFAGPLRHAGQVFHVAFSPNGRYLAAAAGSAGAYLWALDKGKPRTIAKHSGPVTMVAFHPDGTSFATASGKKNVALRNQKIPIVTNRFGVMKTQSLQLPARGSYRLYDVADPGDPIFSGSINGWPNHVGFSPDGRWLVAAGGAIIGRPTAKLLDTVTLKQKEMGWKFSGDVHHASFNSESSRVVFSVGSEGKPNYALAWDIGSDSAVGRELLGHTDRVTRAFFLSSSDAVVSTAWDGSARVWGLSTGSQVGQSMLNNEEILDAALDQNQNLLATACEDGTAQLWDLKANTPLTPPLPHSSPLTSIALARQWGQVATGDSAGVIRMWRVISPESLNAAAVSNSAITAIIADGPEQHLGALTRTRSRVVTSYSDGRSSEGEQLSGYQLVNWDLSQSQQSGSTRKMLAETTLNVSGRFATAVTYDADAGSTSVTVLDLATGKAEHSPLTLPSRIDRAVCGGRDVIIVANDVDEVVWRFDSGWQEVQGVSHAGSVVQTVLSPDGRRAATAFEVTAKEGPGKSHGVHVWEVASGEGVNVGDTSSFVSGMLFSDNSRLLAVTRSKDGPATVHVWEPSGRLLVGPLVHRRSVRDMRFDAGRERLMTASDNDVYSWDLASGESEIFKQYHEQPINVLRLSEDGQYLATASVDGTARLWDAASGEPISAQLFHPSNVRSLAFVDSGRQLATACDDGVIRLWPLPTRTAQVDELGLRAELLSFSRASMPSGLARHGARESLTVDELRERWRQLRELADD